VNLNHVNLCSSDVPALTATLEQHFEYRIIQAGTVPDEAWATNPGSHFAMLTGGDGSNIVITEIRPTPDGRSAYPSGFHIGIMQPTAQAVIEKHEELTKAGYQPGPLSDGFEAVGATWTAFYCPVGDGLEIEVNHRTRSPVLDN